MQGTWVRALAREDHTCRGATKPVCQTIEPVFKSPQTKLLSLHATTTEARTLRARALQQEKPPQWEAHTLQQRIAPTHRN